MGRIAAQTKITTKLTVMIAASPLELSNNRACIKQRSSIDVAAR